LGTIIKSSQFNKKMLDKTNLPIVICSDLPRFNKIIFESGFKELSLNKILVEILVKKDTETRTQFVYEEVIKIITSKQSPVLLTDYEILFDPRYNIDVIRLFYEISRRTKIVIKWCGMLEDDRLVYANPVFKDFHSYNIHDYDIICVI
jgi:hypothetical protein